MHARGNLGHCQGMDRNIDVVDEWEFEINFKKDMLSLSMLALT